MDNKEIEYINAIREVKEKWNGTEEELKLEMKELRKKNESYPMTSTVYKTKY